MFIRTSLNGFEGSVPAYDEICARQTSKERPKSSRILERIILESSPVPKNDIFCQDEEKSTYLTERFADFITLMEGQGFSNQPKVIPSSSVLLSPCRIKNAWMHVLAMPWFSQRKNTVRKLETVIWVESYLQYSKHCVALCGYPLVMLSSSLLKYSELGWFSCMFYNASLFIGYLIPCHLLLDRILAWYCKHYVMSSINEDFFCLDALDNTTYFLYHQQNQLPNVVPSGEQVRGDHLEDGNLQLGGFERKDHGQDYLLWPEYKRIKILTELLSNSKKKLSFHAIVGDTEKVQGEIVSSSHEYEKALPVVNKSYIITQLNTALRLDLYTWCVLLAPFVLFRSHEMSIFAYSYFILQEHYYHRIHLNVTDVLSECKKILEMEWMNVGFVLSLFYDFDV